jgi:CRISPR/Cas system Type II protein with McrA/HNH and RuvC-like nuclease domain
LFQEEEGEAPSSPSSSTQTSSTLSAIEHQETRNTSRRLIEQINYGTDPVTEAKEVVNEVLHCYGGDAGACAHLHNVVIEMTREVWTAFLARTETEGQPVNLPEFDDQELSQNRLNLFTHHPDQRCTVSVEG